MDLHLYDIVGNDILSKCANLNKVMYNETIMLGIRQLCIGLNIKLSQKSRYVCTHIQPLSGCLSIFFYITRQL
jgi:hypothetical protein